MDSFVGAFLSLLIVCIISLFIGDYNASRSFKYEAFERGYMVQCIGMTGYHWECQE